MKMWNSDVVDPNKKSITLLMGLFILLLSISACKPTVMETEAELLEFIRDENNGLIKKREVNGISHSMMYRPTDLLILQETGGGTDREEIKKASSKYENYLYFIYSIELDENSYLHLEGREGYSERLQTLAFGMGESVLMLTSQQDTLPMADYIFSRTFGMSGSTNLMFVFNNELGESEEVTVVVKENGLNTGDLRFRFKAADLQGVPRLRVIREVLGVGAP